MYRFAFLSSSSLHSPLKTFQTVDAIWKKYGKNGEVSKDDFIDFWTEQHNGRKQGHDDEEQNPGEKPVHDDEEQNHGGKHGPDSKSNEEEDNSFGEKHGHDKTDEEQKPSGQHGHD